jgi:hypothetical protein
MKVKNLATTAATNLQLKDLFPSNFTILTSLPSRGQYNSTSGVWDNIGNLAPGDSIELLLTAQAVSVGSAIQRRIHVLHANGVQYSDFNQAYLTSPSMTSEIMVQVYPRPVLNPIGGQDAVCVGGTLLLTNTQGGGVWQSLDTLVAKIDAGGLLSGISVGSATILYMYTNGNGCTDTVSKVITVYTGIPVPQISSSSSNYVLCGGGSSVFLALDTTVVYNNPTYQWYRNDTLIAGAVGKTYTVTDTGYYHIEVIESGGCSGVSSKRHISGGTGSTIASVDLRSSTGSLTLCTGSLSVLELYVANESAYSSPVYKWYKDNHELSVGSVSRITVHDTGIYLVVVRSGLCEVTSVPDTVRLGSVSGVVPPMISSTSGSTVLCGLGSSVVLNVINSSGYTSPHYQWYKGDTLLLNDTDHLYIATRAGTYHVVVTESGCASLSNGIVVTVGSGSVLPVPLVSSSTGSLVLCDGLSVLTLSVSNWGLYLNPRYLWYKNGDSISGSNSPQLLVSDSGIYFVQVLSGGCGVTSGFDTVLRGSVSGLVRPDLHSSGGLVLCGSGSSVMLQVVNSTVYSSGALYSWYRNGTLLSGASGVSLWVTDTGHYHVVVTDGVCGSVSDTLSVTRSGSTLLTKPVVVSSTGSFVLCSGSSSVLELSVSNHTLYGLGAVYVWYKDGMEVQRDTTPRYLVLGSGYYRVHVLLGICETTSDSVKVETGIGSGVSPLPQISGSGGQLQLCGLGSSVLLVLDNHSLYVGQGASYQWYRDSVALVGATGHMYSTGVSGRYRVVVTVGNCGAWSNELDVTVGNHGGTNLPLVSVVSSTGSLSLCGAGSSLVLSVSNSSSYVGGRYRWYRDSLLLVNDTLSDLLVTQGGSYLVHVLVDSCSVTSGSIQVVGGSGGITLPVVSSVSGDTSLCGLGSTLLLTVSNWSSFTSHARYQWYRNDTLLAGDTHRTYVASVAGVYRVEVQEGTCSGLSNRLTVTLGTGSSLSSVVLVSSTGSLSLCTGSGVSVLSLSVSNVFDYPSGVYIWYKDDLEVQRGTSSSLLVHDVGVYYVHVLSGGCGITSGRDTVDRSSATGLTPPVIGSTSGSTVLCGIGSSVVLSLRNGTSYSSGALYQWYKDSVLLFGATGHTLVVTQGGNYSLVVTESGCASLSNGIVVTGGTGASMSPVDLRSNTGVLTLCSSPSVLELYVDNTLDYPSGLYIWYQDGTEVQRGLNSRLLVTQASTYFVYIVSGGCGVTSSAAAVIVDTAQTGLPTPLISSASGGTSLCGSGSSILLTLDNISDYTHATYQWYRIGTVQPVGVDANYTVTQSGSYYVLVTEGNCGSQSNVVTITVGSGVTMVAVDVQSSTGSLTLCNSSSVLLLYVANGSSYSSPRYLWYKGDVLVQDDTLSSYLVRDTGEYYVHVISGSCSATSSRKTVSQSSGTGVTLPLLVSESGHTDLCGSGGSVLLKLSNDIYGPTAIYQWYKEGSIISGASGKVLVVVDSGSYSLVVTVGGCASESLPLAITNSGSAVVDVVVVVSSTGNYALCGVGSSMVLKVSNSSSYPLGTYVWYKDGIEVKRGFDSTLTVTDTGTYMVHVYMSSCSGTSGLFTVTRGVGSVASPSVVSSTGNYVLCGSEGIVLLGISNSSLYTPSAIYRWYKDSIEIVGAGSSNYSVSSPGSYYAIVQEGTCASLSNVVVVSASVGNTIVRPDITSVPSTQDLCCTGSVVVLTVDNASAYSSLAEYIWYRGSIEVGRGRIGIYFADSVGDYTVLVSESNGCSSLSDTVVVGLTTLDSIVKPIVMKNQNIVNLCDAVGSLILSVSNASKYTSSAVYVWYRDSVEVQRDTVSRYSVRTSGVYYVVVFDGSCASLSNSFGFTQSSPPLTQDPCIGCNDCDPSTAEISCASIGDPIVLVNTVMGTYLHSGILWDVTASSNALPLTFVYRLSGATTGTGTSLSGVEFNVGSTVVSWVVTNDYGLSDSCTFTVVVITQDPCIGCNGGVSCSDIGDQTLFADPGSTTYTHTDGSWDITALSTHGIRTLAYKLDGATHKVYHASNSTLDGQSFNLGLTHVKWYVTDSSGNIDSCGFDVNIESNYPCIGCDDNDSTTTEVSCDDILVKDFCADSSGVYIHIGMGWDITATDAHGIDTIYYLLSGATTGSGSSLDSVLFNSGITHVLWTAVNMIGNSSTCSFDVSVQELPRLINVLPQYACAEAQVPAIQFLPLTVHVRWTHVPGTDTLFGLPLSGTGNSMPPFRAVNTQTRLLHARYALEVSSVSGLACSTWDTVDIMIAPKPVVDLVQDMTLCNHDTLRVFFTGTGCTDYSWQRLSGSNVGVPTSGSGDMEYVVNNTQSNAVTLTYKIQGLYDFPYSTCRGTEEQFSFTVFPTARLTPPVDMGIVCSDTFVYQASSATTGVLYGWSRDSIADISGGSSSGKGSLIKQWLENTGTDTVTVIYKVSLEIPGCPADTDYVRVTVLPSPQLSVDYLQEVCQNASELVLSCTLLSVLPCEYLITYEADAKSAGFRDMVSREPLSSTVSLSLPSGVKAGQYHAWIHVYTSDACQYSYPFVIEILEDTKITQEPEPSLNLCVGTSVFTLSVAAVGADLSYQWYKDATAIAGATSSEFTDVYDTLWSGQYYVEVIGRCRTLTSRTVEVGSNPVEILEKWDDVLYVDNSSRQFVRYQWYCNGIAIDEYGQSQYYADKSGFSGVYFVRAYYKDGTYVESCPVTYTRPLPVSTVNVYPNPTYSGRFTVTVLDNGKAVAGTQIEVYDVLGRRLDNQQMKGESLELSSPYASGTYVVRIIKPDGTVINKQLIVQ